MNGIKAVFIRDYSFYGLIFIILLWWFIHQSQNAVNPDNAFLINAAIQFLSGIKMSVGYYDTNPPMSFLVYIPPALMVLWTGIPVYYAIFGYGCLFLALSALALNIIMRQTTDFTTDERYGIVATYLLVNTLGVHTFFAERDQLTALCLFPLFFLQLAITDKKDVYGIVKWGVLLASSLCLLLKPHYGLIPALLFAHRAVTQKRVSIVMDSDFIALALGFIFYLSLIFFVFPDFVQIIFPDAFQMYALYKESYTYEVGLEYATATFVVMLFAYMAFDKPQKKALLLLSFALICLTIYVLQAKSFFYHLIPFIAFFSAAVTLLLLTAFTRHVPQAVKFQLFVVSVFWLVSLHILSKPPIPFLTHEQYKDSQLAQIIKNCEGDCSFFMFNDRIDMMHELAVYTSQPYASRFPTFFFLPFILPSHLAFSAAEKEKLSQKYTDMMVEDFIRFKPHVLIIGRFPLNKTENFDFISFFKEKNTDLAKILDDYTLNESVLVDQNQYTGGIFLTTKPVIYDVYKRK